MNGTTREGTQEDMEDGERIFLMSITAAEQWADAIEAEQNGYDWDKFSLSYSSGRAAGVELNVEADDNFGRRFTSADGQWIAEYDETSGHWYGETRPSEKHTTRLIAAGHTACDEEVGDAP